MTATVYEYPCNERIRCFLRLEYLLDRLMFFADQKSQHEELAFLSALFALMELCDRGDVRSQVLQEMDSQKQTLELYKSSPESDAQAISQVQRRLESCYLELHRSGKLGQAVRDSEWLKKIKNRNLLTSGSPAVEFPQMHAWLCGNVSGRKQLFQRWIQSFMPLNNALAEVLELLRMAGRIEYPVSNEQGVFSKRLEGESFQLIRVWLDADQAIYPEISANKHIAYVRLLRLMPDFEQMGVSKPTTFKLALCKF